jgi:hypothetical protein
MAIVHKEYLKSNVLAALGMGLTLPALEACGSNSKKEEVPSV